MTTLSQPYITDNASNYGGFHIVPSAGHEGESLFGVARCPICPDHTEEAADNGCGIENAMNIAVRNLCTHLRKVHGIEGELTVGPAEPVKTENDPADPFTAYAALPAGIPPA